MKYLRFCIFLCAFFTCNSGFSWAAELGNDTDPTPGVQVTNGPQIVGQDQQRVPITCPEGNYPNNTANGWKCYPCLGCHPCPSPGSPDDYCDNGNNAVVVMGNPVPTVVEAENREGGANENTAGVVRGRPVPVVVEAEQRDDTRRPIKLIWRLRYTYPTGCCERGFVCITRGSRGVEPSCPDQKDAEVSNGTASISRTGNELRIMAQADPNGLSAATLSKYSKGRISTAEAAFPTDLATELFESIGLPGPDQEIVFPASGQQYEVMSMLDQRGSETSKLLIAQKTECSIGGEAHVLRVLTSADVAAATPRPSRRPITKVKCSCGKNVYGKDEAACARICEFLNDNGWLF